MSESVRATYTHPLADEYARPGGPWDIPSLDVLLSEHDGNDDADAVAISPAGSAIVASSLATSSAGRHPTTRRSH